jgi:SAM-dependent methyltransferase
MFSVTSDGFRDEAGRMHRFVRLGCHGGSAEWSQKQRSAEQEYCDQLQAVPALVDSLYRLFDRYLVSAIALGPGPRVLDVGCGIHPEFPPYATSLASLCRAGRAVYVGLDPIEQNVETRRYPFICGRLEDVPAALADRFDVFVFSTSLDHFEAIEPVARAVRSLASPGALCVFWNGFHDAHYVAEMAAAQLFARTRDRPTFGRILLALCKLGAVLPLMAARLTARERRLRRGEPLDDIHFHYFTSDNIRPILGQFGELTDLTHVPGSNSAFATVVVDSAS